MEAILSSKVIADGDATIASGRNDGNARAEDGAAPFSYWRSTISFLISAIAFAGFSPFGQVLVQFMMVWQRYSRNGSSRASRRSPVCSSRLSDRKSVVSGKSVSVRVDLGGRRILQK